MTQRNGASERCALCRCQIHRSGDYATPTVQGRSHATEHHFVPERFFGRSKNRRGTKRDGIYAMCPWGYEGKTALYCYECHEELLHNPVLLPEDIAVFAELVERRGLNESIKPDNREKIAGRVELFHEVIAAGLKALHERGQHAEHKGAPAGGRHTRPERQSDSSCGLVHSVLERLPLWREPSQVPFRNGLYFLYEQGETSAHAPLGRIVRIGNHPGSTDSLVRRLQQHYSGRKNGSVFRKFLGGALIRSANPSSPCLMPGPGRGHWERQHESVCQVCAPVEDQVSSLLGEKFAFRCVEVLDREERNRFEKVLIATVSACNQCVPSECWLGRHAYSSVVRDCGMWNSHGVGGNQLLNDDLHRFEELVALTIDKWHLKPNC